MNKIISVTLKVLNQIDEVDFKGISGKPTYSKKIAYILNAAAQLDQENEELKAKLQSLGGQNVSA